MNDKDQFEKQEGKAETKDSRKFPMTLTRLDVGPEIPVECSPTFLYLVQKLLTPEEIRKAREEGDRIHEEGMKKRVRPSKNLANGKSETP
ncbi:MAG: hypothetical protein ABFD98_05975 [Syntrophobacteraceae bacterium]